MPRRGTAAWILFASLLAMVFASPVGAADAPVPTHDVGDKVGFGTSANLGEAAASLIKLIRARDRNDTNFTIHELEFNGTFDLWTTTEVIEKSAEAYSIRTNSALGFWIDYLVNVTSTQFPEAGTYPGDMSSGTCLPPAFPLTTKTLFADVNITYLLASTGVSSWTVAEFALLGDETNFSIELEGPAVYRDLPIISQNHTACEFTVEYESFDITLSADVDLDLQTGYTPALDVFSFPIANGEVWSVDSSVTMAGQVRGTLDVDGLTPEEETEYFEHVQHALESAGLTATGLDSFPIILEEVTIMAGVTPLLKDGVIHDITSPVHVSLQARETMVRLADGKLHPVYLITNPAGLTGGLCSQVYSPEDGFIVGFRCSLGPITFFELANVPPETAEERIAETKQRYSVGGSTEPPTDDETDNPSEEQTDTSTDGGQDVFASFFMTPPFFGSLLIAAVGLVVAALLVRRRKQPPTGPPPAPPEAPPPETR